MNKRGTGQKASFITAMIFYVCAVFCLAAMFWSGFEYGRDDPITASFAASIVFFIGAGIVLHVIGRVNLPNLSMRSFQDERPPE